jgi:hypothetical protein
MRRSRTSRATTRAPRPLYREIGARTLEAGARLHAALHLVGEGRRGAGEAELRPALEFFRAVGATRCIAEGEALLAAVV